MTPEVLCSRCSEPLDDHADMVLDGDKLLYICPLGHREPPRKYPIEATDEQVAAEIPEGE